MKKSDFIKALKAIEQQHNHDNKCSKLLMQAFSDSLFVWYDNSVIVSALEDLLASMLNDKSEWIKYWIYELEFGAKYKPGCVTENGKNIPLKTASDLWTMLQPKK